MAEIRGLVMRIQAVDGGFVQVMNRAANEGTQALNRLGQGQRRVKRETDQSSEGISRWVTRLRQSAATIAVLDGPLGGIASRFNAFATTLNIFQGRMVAVALGLTGLGIGVGALGVALVRTVSAGAQLERQLDRLDAQIGLTRGRFIGTAEDINAVARQLARDTLTSAQEARDAASTALSFEGVDTENLEQVLRLAQDITEATGGDLRTNVGIIAKAFVAPASSLDELRRRGILFTAVQRQMIDNFVAMGREGEAAQIILNQIETSFGGIAQQAAQNLLGDLDTINEKLGQISENIGGSTSGFVRWLLNITQINLALDAVIEATSKIGQPQSIEDIRRLVEQAEARVRLTESQLQQAREFSGGGGPLVETYERLNREAQEALETEQRRLRTAERLGGVIEHEARINRNALQELRRRQDLENELFDAREKVRAEAERLGIEIDLVGLDEAEIEFRAFVRENFEGLSPEISPRLDLGPLREAFNELQARQEAFAAEQERIKRLERAAPIPRFAPEDVRAGFAAGVGAPTPLLKPDVEIRNEFAAIRAEVLPLNVAMDELLTKLDVLSAAERAGIDTAGVERILEQERVLLQLEIQAAETAAGFREHFGAAANQAAGFVEAASLRMSTALGDFAVGQRGAGEAFRSFWAGLFEDLSRRAAAFALTTAFLSGAEAAGPGILRTVLSGLAGGATATATGGPRGDQSILVGERGPEVVDLHGSAWVHPHSSRTTQRALRYLGRAQFGGEFTVPGDGGPDSQLVGIRATPGERISVSQPQRAFIQADVNMRGMGESPSDQELARQVATLLFPEVQRMTRGQILDMQERHRMLARRG